MNNESQYEEVIRRNKKEAESLLSDKVATENLLIAAKEKTRDIALDELVDNILLLCQLVSDWIKGKYVRIPIATIVTGIAAVLYFVSPMDLIPDFIPVIGMVDDLAIVSFVLKGMQRDLEEYRRWRCGVNTNNSVYDVQV